MKYLFNKQFYLTMVFYSILIFAVISSLFLIMNSFMLKDIALILFQVFTLSFIATFSQYIYAILSERNRVNKTLLKLYVFVPILLISGIHYLIICLFFQDDNYVFFTIPWFYYNLIIPVCIYLSYILYLKYTEVIYNNQLKKVQQNDEF